MHVLSTAAISNYYIIAISGLYVSTTLYKQSEVTIVSDIENHIFGENYFDSKIYSTCIHAHSVTKYCVVFTWYTQHR